MSSSRNHPPTARAFTLIEIIVVVIILGVLATLITPRMFSLAPREAKVEVERVQRLLTTLAQRDRLFSQSGQPMMLEFKDARFSVLTLGQKSGTAAGSQLVWRPDPMIEPAPLTRLELTRAVVGSQVFTGKSWRVALSGDNAASTGADIRPAITLSFDPPLSRQNKAQSQGASSWTIELTSSSLHAESWSLDEPRRQAFNTPARVDLDDSGRGSEGGSSSW